MTGRRNILIARIEIRRSRLIERLRRVRALNTVRSTPDREKRIANYDAVLTKCTARLIDLYLTTDQ